MKPLLAVSALALASCAPALERAGVDPVIADLVEASACAALPARFEGETREMRDAALDVMRQYCDARPGLVSLTYQCPLTIVQTYADPADPFVIAHRAVCPQGEVGAPGAYGLPTDG